MARYDKYDPISGGFRAILAADLTLTNGSIGPVAVSLNASGKVVVGTAGQSGLVGILVKNVAKGPIGPWGTALNGGAPLAQAPIGAMAGDVVDIMSDGEITDLNTTTFPAGSKVYSNSAGVLSTTGGVGTFQIGWTVEAGRLIVRCGADNRVQ